MTNHNLALLIDGMGLVIEDVCESVSEDCRCLLEGNSVLPKITLRFLLVPFEFESHMRSHV